MRENWITDAMTTSGGIVELCEMRLACAEGRGIVTLRVTDRRVPEHLRVCVACSEEAVQRYANLELVGARARERDRQIREIKKLTRDEIKDILLVAAAAPNGCRFSEVRDQHGFGDAEGRKAVLDLESEGLIYREPRMARLKDATLHYPDDF